MTDTQGGLASYSVCPGAFRSCPPPHPAMPPSCQNKMAQPSPGWVLEEKNTPTVTLKIQAGCCSETQAPIPQDAHLLAARTKAGAEACCYALGRPSSHHPPSWTQHPGPSILDRHYLLHNQKAILTQPMFGLEKRNMSFITFLVQVPLLYSIFIQLNIQGKKNIYTHCSFHLCLPNSDKKSLCTSFHFWQPPLLSSPSRTLTPSRSTCRKAQHPQRGHLTTSSTSRPVWRTSQESG